MPRPVRIRAVAPLEDFRVRLEFTDDTTREIDLEPYLRGPIFEPVRHDPRLFRSVKVEPRAGTIMWENGADIDPDVLYKGLAPAWMEEDSAKPPARTDGGPLGTATPAT
jgi:hypothetical protein